MDGNVPGSVVHGIFWARILEWAAISFSRGSSQPRDQPKSAALQTDALPSEPLGKPMYLIKVNQMGCEQGALKFSYKLKKGMETHFSILAWEIP